VTDGRESATRGKPGRGTGTDAFRMNTRRRSALFSMQGSDQFPFRKPLTEVKVRVKAAGGAMTPGQGAGRDIQSHPLIDPLLDSIPGPTLSRGKFTPPQTGANKTETKNTAAKTTTQITRPGNNCITESCWYFFLVGEMLSDAVKIAVKKQIHSKFDCLFGKSAQEP